MNLPATREFLWDWLSARLGHISQASSLGLVGEEQPGSPGELQSLGISKELWVLAMFIAVSPLRCHAKHRWLAGLEHEEEDVQQQKELSDPLIYSLFSKISWQMVGCIWEEQEKRKWEYNTKAIREWFYSQAKTQPRQNTASGLWCVSACLPSPRTIPCHLRQGSGPRPLILKSSVS